MTFAVRSAGGAELARATSPSVAATVCNPINFTMHGQQQTHLIDGTPRQGKALIDRVQRLLRVQFAGGYLG